MLDQLLDFVKKNQALCAVAAVVGGLMLHAAQDNAGAGGGGGGLSIPGVGGGGTSQHEVIDQSGFERPMRALTIPVPQGWQAQSEIRWNNTTGVCSAGIASPHIRMASGDGREAIQILPGYLVTTDSSNITNRGTQPGDFCVLALTDSGESLIRNVAVPRLRQGARIDRINTVPLTAEQQQAAAQMEQLRQSSGGQGRFEIYSLEAWLTHPDGTAEVLLVSGFVIAYPQIIRGVPPIVLNTTDSIISVRTSPERAQALLQTARTLIAGVQFNPEWKSQIEETQRVLTAPVSARGGGGGGGSRGGGSGVDMDRWREDQRRDDEAQRRRIDTIREVERCYDPETGRTYEVPSSLGC